LATLSNLFGRLKSRYILGEIDKELKKLNKSVLKLWYIRAAIGSLALVGVFTSTAIILNETGVSADVKLAVLLGAGIPVALLLAITLIMLALRYKMYAWGYSKEYHFF